MIRLLIALLAVNVVGFAAVSSGEEPARFSARFRMEIRRGEVTSSWMTQITGTVDRPQTTEVGRVDNLRVEVFVEPTPHGKTYAFFARFRVTEKRADGADRVLAEPTILTLAGTKAHFFSGAEDQDYTKVEFAPEIK